MPLPVNDAPPPAYRVSVDDPLHHVLESIYEKNTCGELLLSNDRLLLVMSLDGLEKLQMVLSDAQIQEKVHGSLKDLQEGRVKVFEKGERP